MTGSRADLFCHERTITSLQFFMNLICIVLQNSGESCPSMNRGFVSLWTDVSGSTFLTLTTFEKWPVSH